MSADSNQCGRRGQWKWLIIADLHKRVQYPISQDTHTIITSSGYQSPFSCILALTTAFSTMSAQNFLHSVGTQKRQKKQREKTEVILYLAL